MRGMKRQDKLKRLTLGLGQRLVHVGRHHAVVVEVVEIVALLTRDGDLLEPLDHAPADEPGDDNTDRKAVVWRKPPVVLLVRNDDVRGGVHGLVVGERGPVGAVLALGELALRATEADVVGAVFGGLLKSENM